jgi:hypothetical protein
MSRLRAKALSFNIVPAATGWFSLHGVSFFLMAFICQKIQNTKKMKIWRNRKKSFGKQLCKSHKNCTFVPQTNNALHYEEYFIVNRPVNVADHRLQQFKQC